MKAVVQRVASSCVRVEGQFVARIGPGFLVLLGVAGNDEEADLIFLADKVVHLRVFPDREGRMNRSLIETAGEMLVVSQFTLLGDTAKGRRPSFFDAMEPAGAREMVERFVSRVSGTGIGVQQGVFGAMMEVELINDGPVTILLDSGDRRRKNKER